MIFRSDGWLANARACKINAISFLFFFSFERIVNQMNGILICQIHLSHKAIEGKTLALGSNLI
jgi:hypothetical protein